jgi:hypothetical protein
LTFPEVKTLMDGVTVGGRKVSDQEQVLDILPAQKGEDSYGAMHEKPLA